ncbi:hypothetical protein HYPSUDRAFT_1042270 [Hypholoma sublateritium FD-334 SS-4]|uniref:Uncharacterized protein n=1 Tax=Hypholoma sublateritium (strain FD-334 SS-4) TaxID=945553 RepID=A0A0D2NKQ9_HYPSF|nr:hypothetical protein HYPSUDRAFT_1042270 [Hypholoma sublateritium FD-334 SS-4]
MGPVPSGTASHRRHEHRRLRRRRPSPIPPVSTSHDPLAPAAMLALALFFVVLPLQYPTPATVISNFRNLLTARRPLSPLSRVTALLTAQVRTTRTLTRRRTRGTSARCTRLSTPPRRLPLHRRLSTEESMTHRPASTLAPAPVLRPPTPSVLDSPCRPQTMKPPPPFAVFVDGSGASHHPPPPSTSIAAISGTNAICNVTTSVDIGAVPDLNSAPCACVGPSGAPQRRHVSLKGPVEPPCARTSFDARTGAFSCSFTL